MLIEFVEWLNSNQYAVWPPPQNRERLFDKAGGMEFPIIFGVKYIRRPNARISKINSAYLPNARARRKPLDRPAGIFPSKRSIALATSIFDNHHIDIAIGIKRKKC